MANKKETIKQYIKRMTQTEGEIFKPTGFISASSYKYKGKTMLFLECYTDCIYKANQPVAKFWIRPIYAVWLAWHLLEESKIWNLKKIRKCRPLTSQEQKQKALVVLNRRPKCMSKNNVDS